MRISVRVTPRSSHNSIAWENGSLRAHLTAPPVEGAANAALIDLLSAQLALPRRCITIVGGARSRQKVVEIAGLTPEEVARRLTAPG
ncbi:MAG TPA: DUF167 domain-containing protein [Ktedonobacteraceae bacterium]|jgi:uncharacterized protein (TIGR00251 family)|nr:DUF167 domain-containing protein [Ktedonobacteraceae bacterium]